jgi:hypothetical protein
VPPLADVVGEEAPGDVEDEPLGDEEVDDEPLGDEEDVPEVDEPVADVPAALVPSDAFVSTNSFPLPMPPPPNTSVSFCTQPVIVTDPLVSAEPDVPVARLLSSIEPLLEVALLLSLSSAPAVDCPCSVSLVEPVDGEDCDWALALRLHERASARHSPVMCGAFIMMCRPPVSRWNPSDPVRELQSHRHIANAEPRENDEPWLTHGRVL